MIKKKVKREKEIINRLYSNMVLLIDEVHNLNIHDNEEKKMR